MIKWLHENKFIIHLTIFLLMVLASTGLYLATENGGTPLIWILLGAFMLANLFAMVVK
jgi:hypothetical protein